MVMQLEQVDWLALGARALVINDGDQEHEHALRWREATTGEVLAIAEDGEVTAASGLRVEAVLWCSGCEYEAWCVRLP